MQTEIAERVRLVYQQTWRDFHENKPSATAVLREQFTTSEVRALDQRRCERVLERDVTTPTDASSFTSFIKASQVLSQPPSPAPIFDTPRDDRATGLRRIKQTPFAKGLPETGVAPVPRYWSCRYGSVSLWDKGDTFMPFIPSCEEDGKFDLEEYESLFDCGTEWTVPGRDPDTDIILVETLDRLAEEGITDETIIDETRILPAEVDHIREYVFERSLPPFPGPSHRVPFSYNTGLDRIQGEEMFCPQATCRTYGCMQHINNGVNAFVPVRSYPPPSAEAIAPSPKGKPCSAECILRGASESDGAQSPWPEAHVEKLKVIMSGAETQQMQYSSCSLKMFYRLDGRRYTCREVAYEIQRILDAEPPISVSNAEPASSNEAAPTEWHGHEMDISTVRAAVSAMSHVVADSRAVHATVDDRKTVQESVAPALANAESQTENAIPMCAGRAVQSMLYPFLQLADTAQTTSVAGYGLFADQDIEKGVIFSGELLYSLMPSEWPTSRRVHRRVDRTGGERQAGDAIGRNYLYDPRSAWIIDSARYGNLSRFINHSKKSNCTAQPAVCVLGDYRIAILTTRKVKRNEELLFDYGKLYGAIGNKAKKSKHSD
ncbi:hypothetical protein P7C73_g4976, partial [Tremellales sp. Uapishka_1]